MQDEKFFKQIFVLIYRCACNYRKNNKFIYQNILKTFLVLYVNTYKIIHFICNFRKLKQIIILILVLFNRYIIFTNWN
jgi:C4-type Zn-finger protein